MFTKISTPSQLKGALGFTPEPGVTLDLNYDRSAILLYNCTIIFTTGKETAPAEGSRILPNNRGVTLLFGNLSNVKTQATLLPSPQLAQLPLIISQPAAILHGMNQPLQLQLLTLKQIDLALLEEIPLAVLGLH